MLRVIKLEDRYFRDLTTKITFSWSGVSCDFQMLSQGKKIFMNDIYQTFPFYAYSVWIFANYTQQKMYTTEKTGYKLSFFLRR